MAKGAGNMAGRRYRQLYQTLPGKVQKLIQKHLGFIVAGRTVVIPPNEVRSIPAMFCGPPVDPNSYAIFVDGAVARGLELKRDPYDSLRCGLAHLSCYHPLDTNIIVQAGEVVGYIIDKVRSG